MGERHTCHKQLTRHLQKVRQRGQNLRRSHVQTFIPSRGLSPIGYVAQIQDGGEDRKDPAEEEKDFNNIRVVARHMQLFYNTLLFRHLFTVEQNRRFVTEMLMIFWNGNNFLRTVAFQENSTQYLKTLKKMVPSVNALV